MTRSALDTSTVAGAREHLVRKRGMVTEFDKERSFSPKEIDAAVTILRDWMDRTRPREFRFSEACGELAADAELTKAALVTMLGFGLVTRNARVYRPATVKVGQRW